MSRSETPTTAPPDVESVTAFNQRFVQQRLPGWLIIAKPAIVEALGKSLGLSQQYHLKVQTMLKGLRSAQAFAAPLLTEALRQQFGEGLNINADLYLQGTPVLVIDRRPLGNREWRTDYIKRSLLQAALHNFEASQASVSGAANLNRLERADNSALPVPIRPEQFASLCRSLDLGAKYQAHINAFFNPSANDNETAAQARTRVLANLKGSKRHDLAVAAHMAFIRGQISLAVYQMVLQVTELKPDATLDGYAVYHKRMSILDQPLLDIMLFETWTPTGTFDEFAQRQYRLRKLVIYIPDDPVSPLKEFATWDACESYLCERLGQADYRSFFCRFVMHKDVPRFLAAMELALKEKASLRLGASTISGDPFDDGVRRSLEKVLADARFQAVPTADEDLKTLQENRRKIEQLGLELLNAAAFFVPGLGELMFGVTVVQLLGEVYHGVEDWSDGHRQEALAHLMEVARSVALTAALGGLVVASRAVSSRFFDGLIPVDLANGQRRLWQPELSPYKVNLAIGEEATTGQQGLFKVGDQYHVRMDGQTYRTWFDESTGKWRLRHPSRAHAYAPMLEHNAAGAWRAALDNPLQWQGNPYLFRRLGVGFATLSDESIERILAVTGMDEAALRRIHFDNAKPSGHLLDTVARFQLDRDLARFIQHLNTADPASNLESTLAGLRKDSALSRLWDVLDAQQRSALADEGAEWTQSLTAQQIAERANAQRTYLFDTFYSAGNRPTPDAEATVCRDFPGLPLPVVKQLIENATDAERIRLTAELRLPLRMAEEAREHLREVRLNRANEGFYLDSVSNRDTDTLTLHFLEHLGEVDNADERRLALATLATGQRRESARALGQAPTPSWFNPPQRLGANRVGYPLSGRGDPASGRAHINGLFRSLYPDFSNEQIEEQLGWWRASGTNSWQALQLLERQFSSFDNALSRWEYEPIASTSSRRRPERVQVANVLRRCWRRQTAAIEAPNGRILGYRLNLEGSRIGQFPKLPEDVDLSHIVDLNLHGMQLAQVPEDFLRLFTGVRWLDISNNQLTHLPAVSGRMSQLRALNLQGNQIRLSTADTATLGQLLRLEELNLSSNPVGEVPDVSRLRRLQVLRLRNTGIDRLPDGLLGRRLPVSVDLRENRIHDLPDALLSSETHLMQHIIVHDNPLSESTLTRLRAFRQRSAMGQEIHAHNASPAAAARALWLPARDNPQWLHRRQCWDRVSAEPAAQDFIRLLVDLSETSDFQHAREDLTRRVWEVLDGAYQNTDLRKELFELAANPRSCSDSILVNFSALEVRTFVFNTRSNARSSQDSSGLLTLARGLFRLEQLERLAREHIAALPAIAGVPPVDEIEVDLAYRTGLADRLELPGQPRTMSFELIAGVTPADLDTAAAQVLAAENTSQLQTFIAERDFWIDFLKKKYVEELEKVELPFREREDALIEQQTELTSAVYEQRYLALAEERNAAVAELITRLTAREQAPVTVALPETDEPAQTPAGSGGK